MTNFARAALSLLMVPILAGCEGVRQGGVPPTLPIDSVAAAAAAAHAPADSPLDPAPTLVSAGVSDSFAPIPAADLQRIAAADPTVRGKAPDRIRGIYLNAYAAGSRSRLTQLLALADRTEINSFVVDVKDERGVHYQSSVPLAQELAQPGEISIRRLSALADTLHAHGLHAVARIVVFKDPILSRAKPEWSVRSPDGSLWVDKAGNTWVSPWEPAVWDYNIDIAREAIEAGFDEVQFDYVRFPEAYKSLPEQVHPKAAGTKTEAIVAFLGRARERIHPLGGVVAADVFGLSPNDARDVNIGQQWEPILAVADHVLPMVYPSHYFPTHLKNVPRPNRMPYETVFNSVGIGMIRQQRLADAGVPTARVVPWLQAFSAPWVDRDYDYGAEQAAAQMRGVYDVGLEDWIFWHPGSRYDQIADAFAATTEARAVPFSPPEFLVAQVDVMDRNGLRAIRERVAATHARSGQ
jgi:hypothetical protein